MSTAPNTIAAASSSSSGPSGSAPVGASSSVPANPPATNTVSSSSSNTPASVAPNKLEISEDQRICDEYQLLLYKSQQLFTGLRDLPSFGAKQWQPYFQKTFETYTKLWKFQQQYRTTLENKERYGLKRWEIGEIASKIGQLYYHYYLRTSDTTYLKESDVFYEAIRQRGYFRDVLESKSSMLMVKKLRYYARYIVVSLLLNKKSLAKDLMTEFQIHVDDYTKIFKPADAQEWQLVLHEITSFTQADQPIQVNDIPADHNTITLRLQDLIIPKPAGSAQPRLRLEEAVLVGIHQNQVKFSELTIDMFRMLQTLERDFPLQEEKSEGKEELDRLGNRRQNPKKYLLYRPTVSQFLVHLASITKDLSDSGVILVHISADLMRKTGSSDSGPYTRGINFNPSSGSQTSSQENASASCLYPEDLIPFTRKPMFLIVDSEFSTTFKVQSTFGQPVVSLFSPVANPPDLPDPHTVGNLFTLFLSSPIYAFFMIAGVNNVSYQQYEACATVFQNLQEEMVPYLFTVNSPPASVLRFLEDDFLQQLIIRFIVFRAIMMTFNKTQGKAEYLPESTPALPVSIYKSPLIVQVVRQLAGIAHIPEAFEAQ